jgi:Domain of unknown function (DUF4476)
MRQLLVLLFAGASFIGADAQSMLKVRLSDGSPINVAVDYRYFNKKGTSITVGDLPPGRHFVQIYFASENRRGRRYEEVIYEGKVKTHVGGIILLTYDPETRQVQMDEQDMDAYMNGQPQQGQEAQQPAQNDMPANDGGNGNYGSNENTAPGASPAPTGTLEDARIDNLKTRVAAKSTDTEKMKELKDALGNDTYTTYQVGSMMDWFSFESTKVDFAKWAYAKTVDKDYFTDLESKLTYKNYREELDAFIKSGGR